MYRICVTLILVSYLYGAQSKVILKFNDLEDVASNLINHVSVDTKMHVELPTYKPETKEADKVADSKDDEPSVVKAAVEVVPKTNETVANCDELRNISENVINSEEIELCKDKVKVDNGTALILTPLIEDGKIEEARSSSRVDPDLFLGFESHTGFLTVNKTYDSNLFFWYFPVQDKPVNETPWIIWLQGGPGASSLVGLFDEIGPFKVGPNNVLIKNEFTWLCNHSLVFIDNPVGTGYSFTNHEDGYVSDMATYADHLHSAVQQLLQVFPELRNAPLYIAGESYAGKYVPALAMEIHKHNNTSELHVNLKGLMLGNAYVDPEMIARISRSFYYFGLLDKEQLGIVEPLLSKFRQDIANNDSIGAKNKWNSLIVILLFMTNQRHAYNFLKDDSEMGHFIPFFDSSNIKKAIHVGDIKFSFVNVTVNVKMSPDFLSSSKGLVEQLLEHYRVLVYCGQLDLMIPCVSILDQNRTWKWNGTKEFLEARRYPYIYNKRLAGYHKTGGQLTEVVVRGAGHMVPVDTPEPVQTMVARWTYDKPLSKHFGAYEGSYIEDYIKNHTNVYFFSIIMTMTLASESIPELYLTPMIKSNTTNEIRNVSKVKSDIFHIESYTGYLTVNKIFNSNLFFWYIPVPGKDVLKTPWIIWLQGGPGASSMFGLFKEVGPFRYKNNAIEIRDTSWCKKYSMVFIDNPVGAGFSFTDSDDGYPELIETYSEHLYIAVKQLVQLYPELGKTPLYIAGESYAGRYVPGLAMKILDEQHNGEKLVDLEGLIMGNPTLDRDSIMDYISVFYNWGLIDAQGASAAKPVQEQFQMAIQRGDAVQAYELRDKLLDILQDLSYKYTTYNALKNYKDIDDFGEFLTRSDIRQIIHVGNRVFTISSPIVHHHMKKDSLASISPRIEQILEHCKVLIYCGQLDLTSPCVQNAEARRRKWHWTGRDDFLNAPRIPWVFNDTLTGYIKSGGRLTEVSITGAGHLVPVDKPAELLQLVTDFIEDIPIRAPTSLTKNKVAEYMEYSSGQTNTGYVIGLIASGAINVLLLLGIIVSIVMAVRYKKQYYMSLPLSEDTLALESKLHLEACKNLSRMRGPWEPIYAKQVIGTPYLFAACWQSLLATDDFSLPDLPPGEAPEPILTFMERTYRAGRTREGDDGDAGEPLLLTPLIATKKFDEARQAARVKCDLFTSDIESFSGYLTVNKEYNSNLWFWYFPVADKPVEETPWLIWLQGGPGASSLYGLFTEIGPYTVTDDNNLEEIKYSWGKNHSLLFIDNPVGTGFSFTDDDRGFATNQTTIGENLYDAVQQFLTLFPELRAAPLTIAGESYAGKHIPSLAAQIHWNRNAEKPINLQGLAIGNGFIDPLTLQKYSYFVRETGLVDDRVANVMNHLESAVVQFINDGEMLKAYAYYNYLLNLFLSESKLSNLYNYLQDDISIDGAYLNFIQRSEVRRALHVGITNFTSIGVVYRKLVPDFMGSGKYMLEELIDNYKVMLYSGHLDIIVAYHPSVNTYNSLTFSGAADFRSAKRKPWYHDGNLVGYYKVGGNLTEVMVRGAGHMVPADKPAAALGLISAFARGLTLENDTGFLVDDNSV
ncbi:uncharacterized protein LOC121731840 [Aricia agestis]|uniref:uncharacterized protein LOC121731840 n=1 Tax=Aricia agestis TaxID=91739 RepID=UPI001C209639|nr:uncharacterized protein LOC121731840 [Aricia agestis]